MRRQSITLKDAEHLPRWRRPTTRLFGMAAALPMSVATRSALLRTFVKEAAVFLSAALGYLRVNAPGAVFGLAASLWRQNSG